MDTEQKPTAPQASAPDSEVADATETVQAQWKSWAISAGLAAAVFLGVTLYRYNARSNEEKASRMLGEGRTVQHFQTIMTEYPGTGAAPLAMLQVAKGQFDSGDYVMAMSTYASFSTRYPKHPMLPVADLGRVHCMEAMGQTTEALTAYTAFASANTGSYLTPMAVFGKARCLEQLRRLDEAKAVYEDFMAANPKSPWTSEVEQALTLLSREMRKPVVKL